MSNDGGPAYPQLHHINGFPQTNGPHDAGMTLRDYFAAKAMQSILAVTYGHDGDAEERARAAYHQADAMLKARAR